MRRPGKRRSIIVSGKEQSMGDGNTSDIDGDSGRPETRKTCGLATTSCVLGCLGILSLIGSIGQREVAGLVGGCVFMGMPALILGLVALRKIGKSRGGLGGDGRAIAGIVMGSAHALLLAVSMWFLVPVMLRGHEEAYTVRCAINLRQLYALAKSHAFPDSAEGSISSFQSMIDFDPRGPTPALFVCPGGKETPAERRDGGIFKLSPATCSYEIVVKTPKCPTGTGRIFIYEKTPRHRGGRNVLSGDMDGNVTVKTQEESDFQGYLAEIRKSLAED
jgi:hypothetical protein